MPPPMLIPLSNAASGAIVKGTFGSKLSNPEFIAETGVMSCWQQIKTGKRQSQKKTCSTRTNRNYMPTQY